MTKNLSAQGDCLVVTANRVEIDLQGHTIRGNGTGVGMRDRPISSTPQFAITVRNGTIANFQVGVSLENNRVSVVEQLRVVESDFNGIELRSGRVRSNVVFSAHSTGIFVREGGVVSDNFVSQVDGLGSNIGTGIRVGTGSTVVGTERHVNRLPISGHGQRVEPLRPRQNRFADRCGHRGLRQRMFHLGQCQLLTGPMVSKPFRV